MRDDVLIRLGAGDLPLRPTYGVVDAFEGRYHGLIHHLELLAKGQASIQPRSFLILQGLRAARPEGNWDQETVAHRMWERGIWHGTLVDTEIEFIDALCYTPEQFAAKKAQRAAAEAKAKADEEAIFNSIFAPSSESLPST